MKEIRQVYIAQKKKELRNHFLLVGLAAAQMGALAAVTGNIEQVRKRV